jgi:hypothetical protein
MRLVVPVLSDPPALFAEYSVASAPPSTSPEVLVAGLTRIDFSGLSRIAARGALGAGLCESHWMNNAPFLRLGVLGRCRCPKTEQPRAPVCAPGLGVFLLSNDLLNWKNLKPCRTSKTQPTTRTKPACRGWSSTLLQLQPLIGLLGCINLRVQRRIILKPG